MTGVICTAGASGTAIAGTAAAVAGEAAGMAAVAGAIGADAALPGRGEAVGVLLWLVRCRLGGSTQMAPLTYPNGVRTLMPGLAAMGAAARSVAARPRRTGAFAEADTLGRVPSCETLRGIPTRGSACSVIRERHMEAAQYCSGGVIWRDGSIGTLGSCTAGSVDIFWPTGWSMTAAWAGAAALAALAGAAASFDGGHDDAAAGAAPDAERFLLFIMGEDCTMLSARAASISSSLRTRSCWYLRAEQARHTHAYEQQPYVRGCRAFWGWLGGPGMWGARAVHFGDGGTGSEMGMSRWCVNFGVLRRPRRTVRSRPRVALRACPPAPQLAPAAVVAGSHATAASGLLSPYRRVMSSHAS